MVRHEEQQWKKVDENMLSVYVYIIYNLLRAELVLVLPRVLLPPVVL